MIPAEAVEAAAMKLAHLYSDVGDQLLDDEWAREILEAAAPFMLAEAKADAWDEGYDAEDDHTPPTNPYRLTRG